VTTDVGAYDLYLLGRHHWYQRNPESLAKARNYFQLAIERDPKFALAYVGLADTYVGSYYYAGMPVREAASHAQPLIDRALSLDDVLPEAYATQGLLRAELEKPAEAEVDLRRAIALNPNYANAFLWLGITFDAEARPLDALSVFADAAKLDPLNFVVQARMGVDFVNVGRYDDASARMQRAMELAPSHPNPVWGMADLERMRGRLDAAVSWYRKALTIEPRRSDLWVLLGHVLLDLGEASQAAAAFDGALDLSADDADALLGKARILVAGNDAAGLGKFLDQHQLESRTSPAIALDVAYLEFLAGRAAVARRQYDAALLLAESTGFPLHSAWELRLGNAQAVDVASFEAATGMGERVRKRLDELAKVLDRFEANGVVWHGLHYQRARIQALRGERAQALASLNKAYALGWRRSWWMRSDPALSSLRNDAAFRELIARIDTDLAGARSRLQAHESG
jgi:tetratricopeptide (TPR) repeat protein